MKLKARGALFHCGRCGKSYSNPFGHVCTSSGDFKRRGAAHKKSTAAAAVREKKSAARAKETAARQARRQREDEGRRARRAKELAAARARKEKTAASRPARPEHRYEACREEDCERIPCAAYREGREDGYRDGHYDGYARGFPDGVAACPRTHR
jgi:hypothetical protein